MIKGRVKRDDLRHGYTTGACAAAAARAAMMALIRQEEIKLVTIRLPNGEHTGFNIHRCIFNRQNAECCVIKDAGDDPDITNGAEICAAVSWMGKPGVHIEGGPGVGTITRPGLEVTVGLAAINPVPHRMIITEVKDAAAGRLTRRGIKVTISVPAGMELAKRTLNGRLGIVGGISILGTTGIVIPYSVNAYKSCISQALDVAAACGCREAVLTTGRRSEKFAQQNLALPGECYVLAGDYIGFSLKECARRPLKKAVIWGMPGKISKLAAGSLYTNISESAIDTRLLLDVARECGEPDRLLSSLSDTGSANQFLQAMPPQYVNCFAERLCSLAAAKCRESVGGALEIECIMADYEGNILGRACGKE